MSTPNAPKFRLSRVLLAVLITLMLLEGGLQLAGVITGDSWRLPAKRSKSETVYVSHPYIGWTHRPNHSSGPTSIRQASTNTLGFRGAEVLAKKPERTYRIVCLGGSTTWSTGASSDGEAWPALLERRLNKSLGDSSAYDRVEVINAGVSGYSLMESFINLKLRILPLDPDLVLVYHAVNDAQHLRRGSFKPDYSHVRRSWTERADITPLDDALRWSQLYGLLVGTESSREHETIGSRIRVPNYNKLPIRVQDEIERGVENFAWTLREAVALCRLHDVDIALSSFAWVREDVGDAAIKRAPLAAALQRMNQAIFKVAQLEETLFIDLHERGPKAVAYYDDMVHFNDQGNRLASAVFAQSIRGSGLLRRTRPLGPKAPLGDEH